MGIKQDRILVTRREKRAFEAFDAYFRSYGADLPSLMADVSSLLSERDSLKREIAALRAQVSSIEASMGAKVREEVSSVEGRVRKSMEDASERKRGAFDFKGSRIDEQF